jgi:MoxR-like ATPase
MQLHPDDKDSYKKEDILNILEKGYIGLDIDENYANKLGINDKPFTEWGDKLYDYAKKYKKWETQINHFLSLKKGDIGVVRHGENFVALVKVIGNYEFTKKYGLWFRHMYPIEILSTFEDFKGYIIPKAQGTFEISKSGKTFRVIKSIYQKTIQGEIMQNYGDLLKQNHQIILQGPPGTGKTRLAKQIARYIVKGEDEIKDDGEIEPKIDDIKENVKLIQFHPSYSYEDFVRGIVAKTTENKISYEVENKVLIEMAEKANNNPDENFILIIDEINRANLSSVLGELIYALEYRGESVESMYELNGSREIKLPKNLYIVGTMNTADRSIGHIDYAIRRRFIFIDVNSNGNYIENEKAKKLYEKTMKLFEKDYVSPEFYSNVEDIKIGHSYFIAENEGKLKNKFEYQVKPLLLEYVKDGILNENATKIIKDLKID